MSPFRDWYRKEAPVFTGISRGVGGYGFGRYVSAVSAAADGGLQISRSLRFNSADSAYLNRVPSVVGNRTTWTWSGWVKRATLGTGQTIFSAVSNGSNATVLRINSTDNIEFLNYISSAYAGRRVTSAVYRDPSAWYHIVLAWDSTNGTAANRIRLYVNGSEVTVFGTTSDPASADNSFVNSTNTHYLGIDPAFNSQYLPAYLANIHFIDGQALTPASFAETDATTGQWIPKAFSGGSYGTNGFYLKFDDNSSNTASTLGKDTSGNSNNWTPNNFSVGFPTTQQYSTTTTGTAPTPYSNEYYALAFDGNTSTAFSWTPGTWAMNWTSLPSAVTVSSTLRIFCYPRLGTLTVNINGSNVASITGNSVDWRTISFTGTINTISFTGTDFYSGVYAIEVNGAILIDPRANSVNDSLIDSPTNGSQTDTGVGGEVRGNYTVLNALNKGSNVTLSNGNLESSHAGSSVHSRAVGTVGVSSNKWYFEATLTTLGGQWPAVGVALSKTTDNATYVGSETGTVGYYGGGGVNGGGGGRTYSTYTTGDVIGVAIDLDNSRVTFYKNGANAVTSGTTYESITAGEVYVPAVSGYGSSAAWACNFGQRAFAYTAPSGFKALCTTNLPAPLVTKSNTVMDVVTYTGTGASRSITGVGFSPDFLWIKSRSGSGYQHHVYDSVRGIDKFLRTSTTQSEFTVSPLDQITSLNADGFTLGSDSASPGALEVNELNRTYVGWLWDAGTSTVSNTQGSITSQVRANATAGFSVVTYEPTSGWTSNTNATVGHGLGVKPALIIAKNTERSIYWSVYHSALGAASWLRLNTTDAAVTTTVWGNPAVEPTSTVFTFGDDASVGYWANERIVAYCWAPLSGYSNFGSYVGNGSSDGPMVYTGFRPRWILVRSTSGARDWLIYDTARGVYNENVEGPLQPNTSGTAYGSSYLSFDILSNGFKPRAATTNFNASGETHIYAAFAEAPLNYARAR